MKTYKTAMESKTMWLNVLAMLVAGATAILNQDLLKDYPAVAQGFVFALAVANMILRFYTTQPVRVALWAFVLVAFCAVLPSGAIAQQCGPGGCPSPQRVFFAPRFIPAPQRVIYSGPVLAPQRVIYSAPTILAPRNVLSAARAVVAPVRPATYSALLVTLADLPEEIISPVVDLETQAVESMAHGSGSGFIKAVRAATDQARAEGKITFLQQARILAAARLPRMGAEMEKLMAAEMGTNGVIDWENFDPAKFLALIEGILKILLTFGIGG